MEVGRSNCVYVTLLGKKYPVIECHKEPNSVNPPFNEESCLTQESNNESSQSVNVIDTSNSDLAFDSEPQPLMVIENSPSSLKSLATAALRKGSVDESIDEPGTRLNSSDASEEEDSSVSGSFDLDNSHLNDFDCIDEAVSLALSLNQAAEQNFEYQVSKSTSSPVPATNNTKPTTSHVLGVSPPVMTTNNDNKQRVKDITSNQRSNYDKSEHLQVSEAVLNQSVDSTARQLAETTDNQDALNEVSRNDISSVENISSSVESDHAVTSEDSFALDGSENSSQEFHVSVSSKLDIVDYAKSEWKGSTYIARCLRNGYQMLIQNTGRNFLRQIRGDNYCGLRATAFQILTEKVNIFSSLGSYWKNSLQTLPDTLISDYGCSWLEEWSFADRLPFKKGKQLVLLRECMSFLAEQKELSDAMFSNTDRQTHFLTLFNSMSNAEIKLFEALKLLMLKAAIELHQCQSRGEDVPIFVWLLFARDTSEDPKSFMLNHLNPAGNSGGLEQVEMCLLGQALEITLRVFRPSSVEQEDFVSHYPDHMVEVWDKIDLIAEDDRHYNILAK